MLVEETFVRQKIDEEDSLILHDEYCSSKPVQYFSSRLPGPNAGKSNILSWSRTYRSHAFFLLTLGLFFLSATMSDITKVATVFPSRNETESGEIIVEVDQSHQQPEYKTIDELRLDVAAVSLDLMEEDSLRTDKDRLMMVDITPFTTLIHAALDQFGVQGVLIELFQTSQFIMALQTMAEKRNMNAFKAEEIIESAYHQPLLQYSGIPNIHKSQKRVGLCRHCAGNIGCSGCKWWLDHWAGATIADKLLKEGSLRLGDGDERIESAAAFMKELQRIERLNTSDIMVFHAQHGFTWEYLVSERPTMNSYPIDIAKEFCGDLLLKAEYIEHVHNDMARECRHGFGHGLFYVMAQKHLLEFYDISHEVSHQIRPGVGFHLNDTLVCESYQICYGLPKKIIYDQCVFGFEHSYYLVGGDNSFDVGAYLSDKKNSCEQKYKGTGTLDKWKSLHTNTP